MNTTTKRAAVLASFLALEAIGLAAWSATADNQVPATFGAAVGLVSMVGGFIVLMLGVINLSTPARSEPARD